MSNVKYLNDGNFSSEIAQGNVLVDFYADWCGPCKMMEPVITELADTMKDQLSVGKIDIDANQATTSSFGVTSIPTLILFKDGKEVKRIVGVKDAESLKQEITSAL